MHVKFFSAKPYDIRSFDEAGASRGIAIEYLTERLNRETAILAKNASAVCIFVNDIADRTVIEALAGGGTRLIALRCAGYNNVDLAAAGSAGMKVVRVPAYSPHSIAEHTVAMMLSLNRRIHKSYHRVREGNFELDGLLGFDMHGRSAGIIGTGKIGIEVIRILKGFGMNVLCFDVASNPEAGALGASYVDLARLLRESDLVSLHCPLTPSTRHLINETSLSQMKDGVMLINTSRGAVIDTSALIRALKSGKVGLLGLDVYEEEADLFFEDLSATVIRDDVFARLLTFPNVLITGHQAFFTRDALRNIADTTLDSIAAFIAGDPLRNEILLSTPAT